MAGGDCGTAGCNCLVDVGPGLRISGSGALGNPYLIELDSDGGQTFIAESSPTVNLLLSGSGTPGIDPYRLYAEATLRLQDLTDVQDPEGAPAIGDTLVFIDPGGGILPRWEMRPPLPNPSGSVNVGAGLSGTGAIGTPINLRLLGTSAGQVGGLEVFVNSIGNLSAKAPASTPTDWDDIVDKPTYFPANDGSFTGLLSVAHGGTGVNDLSTLTVGNSILLDGRRVYVQSATPAGTIPINSLWFW